MPAGRPTLYKPEYVELAAKASSEGATIQELADLIGVHRDTINEWRVQHREFSAALRVGREPADERVEASLYHRAIGYSHPDVHISVNQGEVTVTPLIKHYPPDTAAAFIWLKNRKGWKDKVDHEVTHTVSDRMREILASNSGK